MKTWVQKIEFEAKVILRMMVKGNFTTHMQQDMRGTEFRMQKKRKRDSSSDWGLNH